MIFLTSPNNPDGSLVAEEDLAAVLQLPVLVVLDEAYVDFSTEPSRLKMVLDAPNLVVLRTFSKSAGLAGVPWCIITCPSAEAASLRSPLTPLQLMACVTQSWQSGWRMCNEVCTFGSVSSQAHHKIAATVTVNICNICIICNHSLQAPA